MKTFCSASLVALALAIGAAPSQARPTDRAIAEARVRMAPKITDGQYMRFDQSTNNGCSGYVDSGENRFDRMYNSIDASNCYTRR